MSYGAAQALVKVAIEKNDLAMLKKYINDGDNEYCRFEDELYDAAARGHTDIFKFMLTQRSYREYELYNALSRAAEHGRFDIAHHCWKIKSSQMQRHAMTPL